MGFLTEQKKISVNVDEDFRKLFNRVAENLGMDERDYGITDVIHTVFRKTDEKFFPDVSKPEDINKIKELEKQLAEEKEIFEKVSSELQAYTKELQETEEKNKKLEKQLAELNDLINNTEKSDKEKTEELANLLAENTELKQKLENAISQLHGKIELSENQAIIEFTDVQKAYVNELIKNKTFAEFLKKANKGGKFDAIIKPLIANEKEDTGRALLGWLFYSAKLGKYPLISFDKWIKSKAKKK